MTTKSQSTVVSVGRATYYWSLVNSASIAIAATTLVLCLLLLVSPVGIGAFRLGAGFVLAGLFYINTGVAAFLGTAFVWRVRSAWLGAVLTLLAATASWLVISAIARYIRSS